MEITPGNVMFVVAVLLFFSVLIGRSGASMECLPSCFLGVGMLAGSMVLAYISITLPQRNL